MPPKKVKSNVEEVESEAEEVDSDVEEVEPGVDPDDYTTWPRTIAFSKYTNHNKTKPAAPQPRPGWHLKHTCWICGWHAQSGERYVCQMKAKHKNAPRGIGEGPLRLPRWPDGSVDDGRETEYKAKLKAAKQKKKDAKAVARAAKANPAKLVPVHEEPGGGKRPQISRAGYGVEIDEDNPWSWPLDIDFDQWENHNDTDAAPVKPRPGGWLIRHTCWICSEHFRKSYFYWRHVQDVHGEHVPHEEEGESPLPKDGYSIHPNNMARRRGFMTPLLRRSSGRILGRSESSVGMDT